jgi:D-arabinose 5-phosphate isomerase GutQ
MTDETLLSVSDSSTVFRQKVLLVVNNVEDSMAKFSTLSLKVDKERDKIPHYDNKFNVILITALLILIYSLFVNIFTALYVYRNKPARLIGHTQQ